MDSYPCPACGFLVFGEPSGSFEICSFCGWEDDHVQLAHPRLRGGANSESLVEAQARVLATYPLNIQQINDIQRDPEWRPLSSDEFIASDNAPESGQDYFNAAAEAAPTYYWRSRK